jgi:hypothetical protein
MSLFGKRGKIMKSLRRFVRWSLVVGCGFAGAASGAAIPSFQAVADKESGPPLISEVDVSCAFFVAEGPPALRVAAPARENEKSVLSDFDVFYVEAGGLDLSADKAWTILEYGPVLNLGGGGTRGTVAFKRGRARFVRMEGSKALFRVEKACGPIRAGDGLVPARETPVVRGRPIAWDVPFQGGDVLGRIVFLDNNLVQIAVGQWALVDVGSENGLSVGRQLTVYREGSGTIPPQALGSVIVIDAGARWATVKVLASNDAIRLGDLLQVK